MRKLKLLIVGTLLAYPIFLPACVVQRPPTSPEWVKPIYFSDATLVWLSERRHEWPATLEGDLLKVYRHNQKVQEILGPRSE